MNLDGKLAIVTGGTAGIGREIAITYAKAGASVHIFGRNHERAQEVVAALQEYKNNEEQQFGASLVDVSDSQAIEGAINEVLEKHGKIDILVNNAGITRDNLLMRISEEDWDSVIDTNLKSAFLTSKAVIRTMMKQRSGKVINVSSVVGLCGNAGQTNYSASKAGLVGFSKSLAREVASRGITVNCIAPGFIETPMTEVLTDAQKEGALAGVPMKRMGKPEEIGQAALYLASADYMTGQTLVVDGGMVM